MKKLRIIIVNICRLLLALTFILSGYVKAVDPLGTQYKLDDYLIAMSLSDHVPDFVTLGGAVGLAALEFFVLIIKETEKHHHHPDSSDGGVF